MQLTMLLPAKRDERQWALARQVGVTHAVTKAAPEISGRPPPWDGAALQAIRDDFASAGLTLCGLEGDPFDMNAIKLGLPDRDRWIDRYREMLRHMGRLDMGLLCYNFMAAFGWCRTRTDVPERGGALTSEFEAAAVADSVAPDQQIGEADLWRNLHYFLDAVLPVAEQEGVRMALHPDDPPLSPLRGVGRILTRAASFDAVLARHPSPANGIAFCQATFKVMGEDLKATSARWLKAGRVAFIHLRDVTGDRRRFRETFHDNGDTPMAEMLRHYHACSYDGPIRPDHTPAMYGETQGAFAGGTSVGYSMTGNVFAAGYYKGICEAAGIPLT